MQIARNLEIIEIAIQVKRSRVEYNCILAISRGIVPARLISREFGIDAIQFIPVRNQTIIKSEMSALDIGKQYLVIDEIYDTGDTLRKVTNVLNESNCGYCFCLSMHKSQGITGRVLGHNNLIGFPVE